jgi:hypothetical protein
MAAFHGIDALDLLPVPFTLRFSRIRSCRKPRIENLFHLRDTRRAKAQGQHIRMVENSCASGRLGIASERASNAANLVGGNRNARTRPAAYDSFIDTAIGHGLGNIGGDEWPIPLCFSHVHGPVGKHFMAALFELAHQGFRKIGSRVTSDGYSHKLNVLVPGTEHLNGVLYFLE